MAQYQKTGMITHLNKHDPVYGVDSDLDLKHALEIVQQAEEAFMALPAKVRSHFDNDPVKLQQAIQDPTRRSEIASLGLLSPEATQLALDAEKAAMSSTEPLSETIVLETDED